MKKFKHLFFVFILCLTSFAALFAAFRTPTKVKAVEIPEGQTLDTNVDTISVKNLSVSGFENQSMIYLLPDSGKSYNFNYSAENTNKNLVLKFKYDVVDTSDKTSENSLEIYFRINEKVWGSTAANDNCILFRGDGVFFRKYENGAFGYNQRSALSQGVHDIEFGRVAILDGDNPTGNYYVYYKVDGTLKYDSISPLTLANIQNNMYIRYGKTNTKNRMYDADLSYETPQYISISDLAGRGNSINSGSRPTYDTTEQATNKSLVFVSNIEVTQTEAEDFWNKYVWIYGDSSFDYDLSCGFRLDYNKVFIGKTTADGNYSGSNAEISIPTPLEKGKTYTIEYGRVAIMNASGFTGKYHVYFKIDGLIIYSIDQALLDGITAGGNAHFSAGTGDLNFTDAFTYETPKEISVSDLKYGGNLVGDSFRINKASDLTYDNTDHTPNYSLVFKYRYDVIETKNNQFHLSCAGTFPTPTAENPDKTKEYKWAYASTYILVRDDGVKGFLGKSTSTNPDVGAQDFACAMTAGHTYNVEYGRLAIMYGDIFTGKYYTYVKVDNAIKAWRYNGIPQVVVEGNLLFISADGHNAIFDKDYTGCGAFHNLTHHDAVAPNCTEAGNIEYWECSVCNKKFSDADGINEVADITVAALGHTPVTDAAVAPTCTEAGKTEGSHCSVCDAILVAQEVVPATGHTPVTDAAVAPTCTEAGKTEGSHCSVCDAILVAQEVVPALGHDYQWIIDKEATYTETGLKHQECTRCHDIINENTVIDVLSHVHSTELTEGVAATCLNAGTNAYYTCSICGKHFEDEQGQLEIADLEAYLPIAALGHNLVVDDAVAPTCTEAGREAGRHCTRCDYAEIGAEIPATGHTPVTDAAVAPTCTEAGKTEGSHCSVCDAILEAQETIPATGHTPVVDEAIPATCTEAGKTEGSHCSVCDAILVAQEVVPALGHDLSKTEAVEPTCTTDGNIAYWTCSRCNKKFSDAEGTTEVTDVVIPAAHNLTHHSAVAPTLTADGSIEYWECSVCGKKFSDAEATTEITNTVLTLEEAKELSLSNLKKGNDSLGYSYYLTANSDFTYDNTDHKPNYSLVFRFKYESLEAKQNQFHFLNDANKWNATSSIILNNDGGTTVNLGKSTKTGPDGWYNLSFDMEVGSRYNIEFGRLAVMNGDTFTGAYYTYLMIDGAIIKDKVFEMPKAAVEGNSVFMSVGDTGGKNMIYDKDYVDPVFETADQISVSNLTGTKVSDNILALDANKTFAYTATAEHKSVVYKFKYEVKDLSTVSVQFHFADDWSESQGFFAGMFWLQASKSYVRTAQEKYTEGKAPFAAAGTYNVEMGKLYITSGFNAGKYYCYVKINDALLLDCYADEMADKAAIFMTGTNGDYLYDINFVPCTTTHTLTKIEAVPATCTEAGVAAYWRCSNCGKLFSDAEGTNEITAPAVIPAAHTFGEMIAEVPATCTEAGTKAHKDCSVCGKHFDAEGNEITDLTIPAGHTFGEMIAEVPATCTEAGTKAHKDCSVCGKHFDAEGNEITDLTIPVSHTLVHHDATPSTCTQAGNIEYWECSVCNKKFSDAAGTTEVADVTVAPHHTLTKVAAKPATCTEAGNVEYYHCSECGKNFSDAAGTQQISSAVIPATGHTYGEDGKCTVCGEADPDYVPPKKKGCKSSIGTIAVLFPTLVIGVAAVAIRKRKER